MKAAAKRAIRAFVAERDEVLRSLDVDRVIAFHAKHNPMFPPIQNRHVAEISMHKGRLAVSTFTEAEKDVSRRWLSDHGYSWHFEPAPFEPNGGAA